MMKGFLLKTDAACIEEVSFDPEHDALEQIYEHLLINHGSRLVEAWPLHALGLPWRDLLLVDEEGRLTASRRLGRFTIGLPTLPDKKPAKRALFVGRGMILRANRSGRFVTPKIRLGVLQSYLEWEPASVRKLVHEGGQA